MMGYYGSMSDWGFMGYFGFVTWLEVIVIGALLIAWLWKQIKK